MRASRLDLSAAIALVALAACSRGSERPAREEVPKVGSRLFDFDDSAVTELEILKHDPADPDAWSARLARDAVVEPGDSRSKEWAIGSGPEGRPLLDHRADSAFVAHLVDTFRTVQVVAHAPNGPPSSFGLDPPHYAFRWKVGAGPAAELRVGMPLTPGATLTEGAYAQAGDAPAVAVRGATLRMIEYLVSFEVLRRRRLLTVEADDVDEIEVWRRGRRAFYAQREGERWVDARERKLPVRVGEWLTALTHVRVRRFLDDEPAALATAGKILREAKEGSITRLVLKGRGLPPVEVSAARETGGVFAAVSSRPRAAFALYDEAIGLFRGPGPR